MILELTDREAEVLKETLTKAKKGWHPTHAPMPDAKHQDFYEVLSSIADKLRREKS